MLKKYYQRKATDDKKQNKSTRVQHQAAAIACVMNDENDETNSTEWSDASVQLRTERDMEVWTLMATELEKFKTLILRERV